MKRSMLKILIYREEHPLAYRLLLYIVLCSTFFAVLVTFVQLYIDYQKDVSLISNRLQQIERTYLQGLASSVWYFDNELMEKQLNGILQLQDIRYLEIRGRDGSLLMAAGQKSSGETITRQFDLHFDHEGHNSPVGALFVTASLEGVYLRLRERMFVILSTQMVKTLLVSICILLIVRYLVTRHLTTMAQYVSHLDLHHLAWPLTLHRAPSKRGPPDELEQVASAINEMRLNLLRDIEERQQIEQERENLIKELEAKNTELEQFTYTVSHDLKSPLITIRGFLTLLEQDAQAGDGEKLTTDMQYISHAADTMQHLLDDLLELSRIGRMVNPFEEVALPELVTGICDVLAGRLAQKQVNVTISPALPTVYGDRTRLAQVFENFIDNAAKFMGDQPHPQIEIGVRRQDGEQVVYVRDNGMGIDKSQHDTIFGLFKKLHTDVEGTGIGLTTVKRIIEIHGGRIWVESDGTGKGTTFCMTFPAGPSETSSGIHPAS